MQKHITKFLILTIILTAALSVNYLFAAWVGPTQAPPGGNTSTPIHVGSTNQVKDGGLSLNALSVFGNGLFQGGVQVGNTTNESAGTIRWTGTDFEGYDGTQWVSLVSGEAVIVIDPNYTDCINAGGSWVDTQNVCYFNSTSCAPGWSKEANYSSTRAGGCDGLLNLSCGSQCSFAGHFRTNTAVESCVYNIGRLSRKGACNLKRETCGATLYETGCTKN